MNRAAFTLVTALLLPGAATLAQVTLTVAADGSGQYTTVQAAVDAVPSSSPQRTIIEIRPGTYTGRVKVPGDKLNITFRGMDPNTTILTCNETSSTPPNETYVHASTVILGANFIAENVTFENSAGSGAGAALSMYAKADRLVFNNCRFLGWQDTLRPERYRQYYYDCYVEGSVDYIYGNGTAYFEDSTITSKAAGYVTAQGRESSSETSGFVFKDCTVTGSASNSSVTLGRPWQAYARVVYDSCWLSAMIKSVGWTDMNNNSATAFFAEYNSTGPGADPSHRVSWSHQLVPDPSSPLSIVPFRRDNWLGGTDNWDPTPELSAPATIYWNRATANWDQAANWSASRVPNSSDKVDISGGKVTANGAGQQAGTIYIGNTVASTGELAVATSGQLTVASALYLGNVSGARGTASLTGGSLMATGPFILASVASSTGELKVSKGAYVQVGGLTINTGNGRSSQVGVEVASDGCSLIRTTATSTVGGAMDVQSLSGFCPKEGDKFVVIASSDPSGVHFTGNFSSFTSNIVLGLPGSSAFSGAASGSNYQLTFLGYTFGDANGNHRVDGGDLSLMGGAWAQSGQTWATCDFTGDGVVDGGDLALLGGNWNWWLPTAPELPIPEPATLGLLAASAAALVRRRKRSRQASGESRAGPPVPPR